MQKKRIDWIDAAKGLGIFLIVYGHAIHSGFMYQWLFSFHVPLFFLLAGITYIYRPGFKNYFFNKIRSLLIPYLVWGTFSIICFEVLGKYIASAKDVGLFDNLKGLLFANSRTGLMQWNRPLWFLPCLFSTLMIVQAIEPIIRKRGGGVHKEEFYVFSYPS